MKSCPQCTKVYDDEYLFCLDDGNPLVAGDDEEVTVVNRFEMGGIGLEDEEGVYCASCGYENKVHSKFCKKCGHPVAGEPSYGNSPSDFQDFHGSGSPPFGAALNDTVTFTPPRGGNSPVPQTSNSSTKMLLIGALAAGFLVLVGVVIVFLRQPSAPSNSNANIRTVETPSTITESSLPQSFERNYSGSIGRFELTMFLKKEGNNLSGSATTVKTDTLSGSIENDGDFHLNGYENGRDFKGIWTGRISDDGSVSGTWTKPDGTKATGFSLTQN